VKEVILKKMFLFFVLVSLVQIGCSSKPKEEPASPEIKSIQDLMVQGSYDDALKLIKAIVEKTPASPDVPTALYLEGYLLAFDKSDFEDSRPPLRKLLEAYPRSVYAVQAQKLIADTQYWQGHYSGGVEEYKKLAAVADPDLILYAKLQTGNCLLMDDKVGDALADYRDLIEKNPGTSIADSAQLMTANAYLKLQNVAQAKKELQKLIAQSQNHDIQASAQKALRQIEEDASFNQDSSNSH
jgi:outer membrane protein assembly factor BamD (BamD/ComL family)